VATARLRVIVDASTSAATSSLSKLGGGIKVAAAGWTAAAGAVGGLAVSSFKTGVAFNTLNQKANASFKTILGSASAADKMMSDISKFAQTSPFPKQAFIEASQQMLAFGYSADDVIPALNGIQNAVAAAGGSSQDLSDITFVMAQIQAAGKITGQDLIQLGQRGINAADLIGSQMGKTGPEIKKMITDGALGAGDALDALTAGMNTKFANAADNVKATWVGATDRISGAFRDIGSAMAEPFVSQKGGGLAVGWANGIADVLRGLIPVIQEVTDKAIKMFGPQLKAAGDVLDFVSGKLKGIDAGKAADSMLKFAPALGTLTGGFAALTGGLGANIPVVGGLLKSMSGPIGIVVAALAGLIATSPQLQQMLGGVLQSALQALQPLLPVISTALTTLVGVLGQVITALAPLIPIIAGAFVSALQTVIPVVMQIASTLLPMLANVLAVVVSALAPVIPIIGKLFTAALSAIIPPIMTIIKALLPVFIALTRILTPIIAAVVNVFKILAPPIMTIVRTVLPPLIRILMTVMAAFKPIIPVVLRLATQIIKLALSAIMPLLPVISKLIKALLPLVPPILKVVGVVVKLLDALMPVINVVVTLAAKLVGALLSALIKLANGPIKLVAKALDGVADAISWVVTQVQRLIDWCSRLKMPKWLNSGGSTIGKIFKSTPPPPQTVTTTGYAATRGTYYAPVPAGRALRAPSVTGTNGGGVTINLTVNAPMGGGDAIARTIEAELTRLSRRRGGLRLGGPLALGGVAPG